MKFDVYTSPLSVAEVEAIFKGFRGDRGWSGHDDAEQIKERPVVWAIGSHADNEPSPKDARVRLDDGRIITRSGSELVKRLLMGGRVSHEKYSELEVEQDDFMNMADLTVPLPEHRKDYGISFGDLE